MPQRLLEICVDSLDLAFAAVRGGADRLELCGPLFDGGVTPSAGFVAAARRMIDLPLAMLVRPRAGSFTSSDAEFEVMRQDILYARNIGINIIVLGLLHSDQTVDMERTRELVELAHPLEVTFHRAFDVSPDLEASLESVLQTGATRVLTSGGQASAVSGAATVKKLRETADNRIAFLLCGGITAATVSAALETSKVAEVHAGLRESARTALSARSFEVFTASVDALRQKIRSMDESESIR
jgi:copper homeostasis protein